MRGLMCKLGLLVVVVSIVLLAGCETTALYKPGATLCEAQDAHERCARLMMTSGPIVRSARSEIRVLNAMLEELGYNWVPVSELPDGVVVAPLDEAGLTHVAGLPGD